MGWSASHLNAGPNQGVLLPVALVDGAEETTYYHACVCFIRMITVRSAELLQL